jgi:hypothetical protein
MEDECWIWTGHTMPNGYGQVNYRGETYLVHRVAYRAFVEDFPDELQINHLCHSRSCFNPSHLYVGTQQDNVDDMWRAGRASGSEARSSPGERHPHAKLTEDQALKLYELAWSGRYTLQEIGDMFGLTGKYVWQIKHEYVWKHLWQRPSWSTPIITEKANGRS